MEFPCNSSITVGLPCDFHALMESRCFLGASMRIPRESGGPSMHVVSHSSMVLPWDHHGSSKLQWCPHGTSMGLLWDIHRTSTRPPSSHGVPMGLAWDFDRFRRGGIGLIWESHWTSKH